MHFLGRDVGIFRYIVAAAHADVAVHLRHFCRVDFSHQAKLFFRASQKHFPLNLRVRVVRVGLSAYSVHFFDNLPRQIFRGRAGVVDVYLIARFYFTGIIYQIFC